MATKRSPRTDVSSSNHSTSGTGTVPSACEGAEHLHLRVELGAREHRCPLGSTRITSPWVTGPSPASQVASNRSVSLENPDRPGMLTRARPRRRARPVCSAEPGGQRGLRGDRIAILRDGHVPPRQTSAVQKLERVLLDPPRQMRSSGAQRTSTRQPTASAGPKGNSPRRCVTAGVDQAEHHAEQAAEHQRVEDEAERPGDGPPVDHPTHPRYRPIRSASFTSPKPMPRG